MTNRKSIHISIVDNLCRKAKAARRQGSDGILARKAKSHRLKKLVDNDFAKHGDQVGFLLIEEE